MSIAWLLAGQWAVKEYRKLVENSVQRRLAAIVAVDVVGYSRLMGKDEAGTLAALTKLRAGQIDPSIREHKGRVFKTTGDGLLVEFPSVVNAVASAVDIQRGMAARNAELPEGQVIELRIGVNLGDVIIEGDDVFGDGVNVAARLEGIASPGGITVSGTVRDHLGNRLDIAFEDLGEQVLKNIANPVRVLRVMRHGLAHNQSSEFEGKVPALADKPSIAVLPFRNLSSDPEQDYFADGIVEGITTALGYFRQITVISRNSAFAFKGNAAGAPDVGRKLGVRYLLQGSVRKSGEKLRLTAHLIEAESGVQLWAEELNGVLTDVFGFQDEVTRRVIGAIAPRVFMAEQERLRRKRPENFGAYELYLRAQASLREMTREGNDLALACVERALVLDSGYAAVAGLGAWAYTMRAAQGWNAAAKEEARKGLLLAAQALAAGQDDAEALSLAGYAIGYLGTRLEEGIKTIDRAITLNPNSALALTNAGWLKTYLGLTDIAIADFEQAKRLSPCDPGLYRLNTGLCCALMLKGEFDAAVDAGRQAMADNPNYIPAQRSLASALAQSGKIEEARLVVESMLQLDAKVTVSAHASQGLLRFSGKFGPILDGLRMAGLPE